MNILAHRGYWEDAKEQNCRQAFERAFLYGYGVETDLRDSCGKLVISHNIAEETDMTCSEFLEVYQEYGKGLPLALNIKADGIQNLLAEQLKKYKVENYFVFDMSIPEMVVYERKKMRFFTRQSDIEQKRVLYEAADGVWLDTFYSEWDIIESAESILSDGKKAVIVSPELHGRPKFPMWDTLKQLQKEDNLYICTDCPQEASEQFGKER